MVSQKQEIRIKLMCHDVNMLNHAVDVVLDSVRATGTIVKGPIPLPNKNNWYVVTRSPHVDKRSGETFRIVNRARLIILSLGKEMMSTVHSNSMQAPIPHGVQIEIKIPGRGE